MVVAVAFENVMSPVVEIPPVNAGDANGAFEFRVVCVAVDIGFVKSLVPFEIPPTVPVM